MDQNPYTNTEEEEKFFKFVNENIDKLTKYSQSKSDNLKLDELNRFLMSFEQVLLSLISMFTYTQFEYDKEKESFDDWFAEKFLIVRNRENRSDLAAQKWMSQKEIEMLVRKDFKEDYISRKTKLLTLERKVAFIHSIQKAWESQQFVLSTLSKNVQTEIATTIRNN